MTRLALVLDDESVWRDAVHDAALGLDIAVEGFANFEDFRKRFSQVTAELVVLDWNMPGTSGLEVLEWIRAGRNASVPVIMLTSREADEDVIAGLSAGADDFVTKPCSVPVLAARMNTQLSRRAANGEVGGILQSGDVQLIRETGVATRSFPVEPLTEREFALAWTLFESINAPVARETLYSRVWGQSKMVQSRSLDTHASSLRKKLHLRPDKGFRLMPIYGYGYRLEKL